MAFENNTNLGRVEKMIETLRLIEKSATSNRATPAQIKALLAPLMEALAPYMAGAVTLDIEDDAGAVPRGSAMAGLKAGERAALHLADRASLRILTAALLGRLEAHEARLAAHEPDDSEEGR